MSGKEHDATITLDSARERLAGTGWLANLSEAIRQDLLASMTVAHYRRGKFLFYTGDAAGGIYGVVQGGVGVHLPLASGELALAHILRTGTWFGYGPFLGGRERSMSFSLTEPTDLAHVSLERLRTITQRSPDHQRALLSVTEGGMDAAVQVIGTLLIPGASKRLAATLLRVAPAAMDSLALTQGQLAELTNLQRQVVNRELNRMQRKGWLTVGYGRVTLLRRDLMQGFVQSA